MGATAFSPGDVLIMNHPYVCGQHLNNVVVYTPFFHEGELVAFLAVRAHWIDIGGRPMGFGFSGTREVYEEGLQFRSLKLYRGEQPNQEIFQIITDNVRFAESSLGDLRAQIAACRVGDRGLGALVKRYGLDAFLTCVRTIWQQSEALAREQVARIKPGSYAAEALFDSDGVNLDIAGAAQSQSGSRRQRHDHRFLRDQRTGGGLDQFRRVRRGSGGAGGVQIARGTLFAHRRRLLSRAES